VQVSDVIVDSFDRFVDGVLGAIPELLSGLVFFVFAYVGIKLVTYLLRGALVRTYPGDQQLIADLIVLIVKVFLWFGAGLILLEIVGLGELAASLGTAVGFISLGISYALSEMIEDTVAGVYLLRDPDFNPGDTVTTDSGTGVVTSIGLRKSRFELEDGDTLVVANHDVESEWTKRNENGATFGDES